MKLPHSTTILGVCQINLFPREKATSFQLAKNSLYLECATALGNISEFQNEGMFTSLNIFSTGDVCLKCI